MNAGDEAFREALNYYHGEDGHYRDVVLAFRLFDEAAEDGSTAALAYLGFLQYVGQGCPKDRTRGFDLLSRGAERGSFDCCSLLALVCREEGLELELRNCIEQLRELGPERAGACLLWREKLPKLFERVAARCEELRQPAAAVNWLDLARRTSGSNSLYFADAAAAIHRRFGEKLAEAAHWESLIKAEPASIGTYGPRLADALQSPDSIEVLDRLVRGDPKNAARYQHRRADLFEQAGHLNEAIKALRKAVAAHCPDSRLHLERVVRLQLQQDKWQEALEELQELSAAHPTLSESYWEQALALYRRHKPPQETLELLEQLTVSYAGHLPFWEELARQYQTCGRRRKAVELLVSLCRSAPPERFERYNRELAGLSPGRALLVRSQRRLNWAPPALTAALLWCLWAALLYLVIACYPLGALFGAIPLIWCAFAAASHTLRAVKHLLSWRPASGR